FDGSLDAALTSASGSILSLPFIDLSLSDLFDASTIQDKISAEVDAIRAYFESNPDTATVQGLVADPATSISLSAGSNPNEYAARINLSNELRSLPLDFSGIFDGFDFPFELSVSQSRDLLIEATLDLEFVFGLDAEGGFYVSDPTMKADLVVGDRALDVVAVDQAGRSFSLAGDWLTRFTDADGTFVDAAYLGGSTDNNGFYTVTDVRYEASTDTTIVQVAEDLYSDTADGQLRPSFDLAVALGPLGLKVEDGALGFEAGFSLGTDGRLAFDLAAGTETTGASIGTPDFTADTSFQVVLPVTPGGFLEGLESAPVVFRAVSGNLPVSSLDSFFTGMDLSISPGSELGGFSQWLDFSNLTLADIINGIRTALNTLADADDPDSLFNRKLPLINQSLTELLGTDQDGLVAALNKVLDAAETATDLQQLEQILNNQLVTLFGPGSDVVSLSYEDSALLVDLNFEQIFARRLDLALDLKDLLPGQLAAFGDVINFNAAAPLDVSAYAGFDLGVGFDLSDLAAPAPFVSGGSGLSFGLEVNNSAPLSFEATIDVPALGVPLGLTVAEGSATLSIEAFFGTGSEERILLSDLALTAQVAGSGAIDLPLYFPIPSLPFGGTTEDRDGDGYGDNVLRISTQFDNTLPSFETVTPSLAGMFDLFAIINDPGLVLAGLENMFSGIKAGLEARFAQIGLPLVGDKLAQAADFVDESLRARVLGIADLSTGMSGSGVFDIDSADGRYASGGLGAALFSADRNGESTSEILIDLVRNALFDGIGDLLRVPETDAEGRPLFDAQGSPLYRAVNGPEDIQFAMDGAGIQFNVLIADNIFNEFIPLSFDTSAPGLGIKSSDGSALNFTLDYAFGLGFGFDAAAGVYLDTSGVTEGGDEFALNLAAQLTPGSVFTAQMGFLEATLSELADEDGGSGLFGGISLDLLDADGDGKWSVGSESLEAVAGLSAAANIDLGIVVDIAASNIALPKIDTVFRYDQNFLDVTYSSTSGPSLSIAGTPDVVVGS
ncbi:MAG: hypothetical protein ACC642_03915, partial [Pseudomonadales bacterium]